jgi:hypothetical protein
LWEKAVKFWPPYADYAKKTDRQIPVVLLDPVGWGVRKAGGLIGRQLEFRIGSRRSNPLNFTFQADVC